MLPNANLAFVPTLKLAAYLLDLDHADGGPKAVFFRSHGFDASTVEELQAGLLWIARTEPVVNRRDTPYGTSTGSLEGSVLREIRP